MKANESVDYSQLNRELSATGTMFSPGTGVGNIAQISSDSPEASPVAAPVLLEDGDGDISMDREVR